MLVKFYSQEVEELLWPVKFEGNSAGAGASEKGFSSFLKGQLRR